VEKRQPVRRNSGNTRMFSQEQESKMQDRKIMHGRYTEDPEQTYPLFGSRKKLRNHQQW
jgi:hypothetical protein